MEINEIYKCEVCGNVVEAVQFATGEISCCGKEMVKQSLAYLKGAII